MNLILLHEALFYIEGDDVVLVAVYCKLNIEEMKQLTEYRWFNGIKIQICSETINNSCEYPQSKLVI